MGRVRVCGKVCHEAKKEKCGCWCGGLFHGQGEGAKAARKAFAEKWGEEPKGQRELQLGWTDAIGAAQAAVGGRLGA